MLFSSIFLFIRSCCFLLHFFLLELDTFRLNYSTHCKTRFISLTFYTDRSSRVFFFDFCCPLTSFSSSTFPTSNGVGCVCVCAAFLREDDSIGTPASCQRPAQEENPILPLFFSRFSSWRKFSHHFPLITKRVQHFSATPLSFPGISHSARRSGKTSPAPPPPDQKEIRNFSQVLLLLLVPPQQAMRFSPSRKSGIPPLNSFLLQPITLATLRFSSGKPQRGLIRDDRRKKKKVSHSLDSTTNLFFTTTTT